MSSKMVDDDFNESELFSAPTVAAGGNPLGAYFRLPGLSVKLPTAGAFFPEGGIELDENNEVSVLPMRAADELLLQSPDALMNNTGIIKLVGSCVPAIKMPNHVSAPDLDVLLIAIRVASNGENMELDLRCPECDTENKFEVNLPSVLATMQDIPATLPLRLSNDMVVYLRPHAVATHSKLMIAAFKETRNAQAIDANTELSDEARAEALSKVMDSLNEMNLYALAHAIIKIVVPGHEVTKLEYIKEFLGNTDRGTLEKLRSEMERINSMGLDKTVPAVCKNCAHEWDGTIEFNPATFFEERSSD